MAAAMGILSALEQRNRTGLGGKVEASLLGQAIFMQSMIFSYAFRTGANPPRMGNKSPLALILEGQTETGGFLVGIPTQKFWVRFCDSAGLEELTDRPDYLTHESRLAHQAQLARDVEPHLNAMTRDHWLTRLIAAGIPCAPINNYDEVTQDRQVLHNREFLEFNHSVAGQTKVANAPWRMEHWQTEVVSSPPALGIDTSRVLEELGCSPEEINALFEAGTTRGEFSEPLDAI
jgi:crotonobetainyl-CoA:carnitine CoA-transferase CaiB-like acyl-CoA transferase